jgi:hypothetical protein
MIDYHISGVSAVVSLQQVGAVRQHITSTLIQPRAVMIRILREKGFGMLVHQTLNGILIFQSSWHFKQYISTSRQ